MLGRWCFILIVNSYLKNGVGAILWRSVEGSSSIFPFFAKSGRGVDWAFSRTKWAKPDIFVVSGIISDKEVSLITESLRELQPSGLLLPEPKNKKAKVAR